MSTQQEIFDTARESLEYETGLYKQYDVTRIPSTYLEPINDFLRHFLPDEFQSKSYAQIVTTKDESGNYIGLAAIKEAWNNAVTFINTRAALDGEDGASFKKAILDIAMMSSGAGTFDNQMQNFFVGFDKYHASKLPAHLEMSGPTFITRPRLCLQSSNLRNNVKMLPLDTFNPNSIAFAIRWLLDTNLANTASAHYGEYADAANNCPFINPESPWMTPMCNALTGISGFPDIAMLTDTTDGGYFSEAQQFATGFDNFVNARHSLTCTFREIPGGIISAMLFYWLEYMRCVTRGIMLAYPDDIDGLIMNYTVSIYQFNMDPSYQYITRWCKCTGCFPTTLDFSSIFTKSENQYYQEAAQKVSTTFACNHIEYMNPNSLMDFNTLAMRYCANINKTSSGYGTTDDNGKGSTLNGSVAIPNTPFSNFCGLPYITSDPNGFKLTYRQSKRDLFNDPMVSKLIAYDMMRSEQEWEMDNKNKFTQYAKYNYEQFYNEHVEKMKANYKIHGFDDLVKDIINGNYKY